MATSNNSTCLLDCEKDLLTIFAKEGFQYRADKSNNLTFIKKIPRSKTLSGRILTEKNIKQDLVSNDRFKIRLSGEHTESHVKTKYGDITHFIKTKILKYNSVSGKLIEGSANLMLPGNAWNEP